jgi:hypothetical protein
LKKNAESVFFKEPHPPFENLVHEFYLMPRHCGAGRVTGARMFVNEHLMSRQLNQEPGRAFGFAKAEETLF